MKTQLSASTVAFISFRIRLTKMLVGAVRGQWGKGITYVNLTLLPPSSLFFSQLPPKGSCSHCTWHCLYRLFTYFYSLLIEKDICDRPNVSVKTLCIYVCFSSGDLVIFLIKVSPLFSYCSASITVSLLLQLIKAKVLAESSGFLSILSRSLSSKTVCSHESGRCHFLLFFFPQCFYEAHENYRLK